MPTKVIKPIIIVQGGQWGSEAKGAITAALCLERAADYCVRTGAVNAGHTVYFHGTECKMQQIPVGFVNPHTTLVLGAGAMINPSILARELEFVSTVMGEDIRRRLIIDNRCGLHLDLHQNRAKIAGRHHKMGATGKGCSEAVVAKISSRGTPNPLIFKEWLQDWGNISDEHVPADQACYLTGLRFADTENILNTAYDRGAQIVIEGTQGTLLDLHLGPYPYTTHKQCIASQWATECGLSPALDYEVVSVCRTYPIRVAGNSGPMPGEISWVKLASRINKSLERYGRPPMVEDWALDEFEKVCASIAREKYGLNNHMIESFSPEMRYEHRIAVSELHKDTLNALSLPAQQQVAKLFEMTTVTRKLRRIAEWDLASMRASMRQNRPAYVILTFINYVFPEYWGCTNIETLLSDVDVVEYLRSLEIATDCVIGYITTGPNTEHMLKVRPM